MHFAAGPPDEERPRRPHWRSTGRGNVEVLNETADFYRLFDATPHAEFLFGCVVRMVDIDLRAGAVR